MPSPTLVPERLERLQTATLARGGHPPNDDCVGCAEEMAAWAHGLEWTDRHESICPAVGAATRALNDAILDDGLRTELLLASPSVAESITVRSIGSRGSQALTEARGWMAVDFAVRTVLPVWMDLLGESRPEALRHALALRALPPIIGPEDLESTRLVREAARKECRAAWDAARAAAWDAAWAAAWDAARAAAWDAAWDAAGVAAWDAAGAAARDAAGDAAWDAARDAAGVAARAAACDVLAPTVLLLQRETAAWIVRMLDVTEGDVAGASS